ncbi:MAG: alpha/beta hydrolase [Akkermansiaceae bacterium]
MKKLTSLLVLTPILLTASCNSKEPTAETEEAPDPIIALQEWLKTPEADRAPLKSLPVWNTALSKDQADKVISGMAKMRLDHLKKERQAEFDAKAITLGKLTMRYEYHTYGKKPKDGHSLYISMHGGGGAPARVNDGQWRNQIRLYKPKEGIYIAPRAPTNTWDLWHQGHIDDFFDRLIANFIAIEGVNPNKVYVMGYSAGGDGTYQLAPRMADRWAGAAMMAGHPGDAQTYNLRNLPYFIQCGGKDAAYKRNELCKKWGETLDQLAKEDPGGYPHKWIVYPQYGHWMNLECKQAVPWMAKHTRNPWPKKLHWYQDNRTGNRFFWLSNKDPKHKQLVSAEVKGQTITIDPATAEKFAPLPAVTLRLSDHLLDLDKPITVKTIAGKILFEGKIKRSTEAIVNSLIERPDTTSAATATLDIKF